MVGAPEYQDPSEQMCKMAALILQPDLAAEKAGDGGEEQAWGSAAEAVSGFPGCVTSSDLQPL